MEYDFWAFLCCFFTASNWSWQPGPTLVPGLFWSYFIQHHKYLLLLFVKHNDSVSYTLGEGINCIILIILTCVYMIPIYKKVCTFCFVFKFLLSVKNNLDVYVKTGDRKEKQAFQKYEYCLIFDIFNILKENQEKICKSKF